MHGRLNDIHPIIADGKGEETRYGQLENNPAGPIQLNPSESLITVHADLSVHVSRTRKGAKNEHVLNAGQRGSQVCMRQPRLLSPSHRGQFESRPKDAKPRANPRKVGFFITRNLRDSLTWWQDHRAGRRVYSPSRENGQNS